ncbi:hypothetical protein NJL88_11575 [Streptomyces sp. DK15]|uniref:hypothetical protein n=1 Tax=Streptomyces sp. DK15 TaxID=2957499 RepID=UPI0029B9A6CE|nr:hypothetical protein [Streptomyces sp. DK15]MDX2390693.1 hypothetical protein [Streptomyces sp. DK15]
MDGATVPGGCDHCNAVQKITANMHGVGIHGVGVHHDDDCSFYNSLPAGSK